MNQSDWQVLLSYPARPDRTMLSVYLNVDQSRQVNLNRGIQTQFRDLMTPLRNAIQDTGEADRFRAAEHHLADFLSAHGPKSRGLALFFDQSENFMYHRELAVPVEGEARWDREFFLRPLAEATDEFERYGVAVIDRANGRLLTVTLGEVEEVTQEAISPSVVRHIKTVGMDQLGSSSNLQRKADEKVRKNLRLVARDLDQLVKSGKVDHIILAGASEPVAELRGLLPKRLAPRVIGSVTVQADAPARDVLAAVLPITMEYERNSEQQAVREVVDSAAKGRKAVVGLDKTLKQVSQRRVWQLIYCEGFRAPGLECPECGALFGTPAPTCFYCTAPLVPASDVVERAIQHGIRDGAKIEVVRGEAAAMLQKEGAIGAFLKTRTRSVAV